MSKKTIACVIARTVSTRLPLKILRTIADEYSMIDFIINRLKLVKNIDDIYICTSYEAVDDILDDIAKKNDVKIYRGSPSEVIERLLSVGEITQADNVIRITGDNVFTSYEYIEEQINLHNTYDLDYTRIINIPIGATAEVMRLSALKHCYNLMDASVSEYLLLYMFQPQYYKCGVINIRNLKNCGDYTVTVDTNNDLIRTKEILSYYTNSPLTITLSDIVNIIDTYKISNSQILCTGKVKMPYDKEISFEEFKNDMQTRINSSKIFELDLI